MLSGSSPFGAHRMNLFFSIKPAIFRMEVTVFVGDRRFYLIIIILNKIKYIRKHIDNATTPWYSELRIIIFHNFNIICIQLRVDFLVLGFSYISCALNSFYCSLLLTGEQSSQWEFIRQVNQCCSWIPHQFHFTIHRS